MIKIFVLKRVYEYDAENIALIRIRPAKKRTRFFNVQALVWNGKQFELRQWWRVKKDQISINVDIDMVNGDPEMLVAWDQWLDKNPPDNTWEYVKAF